MDKQYLILGTGIAGLSAAREIRCQDPEAAVTLIGMEKDSPYLRPLLSKTDFRHLQRQKILAAKESWYEENRITLLKGCAAASIDPKAHLVTLSDGRKLPYDKCIYALGADCFVPPIPGREKKGVLTLRSTGDFHKLRKYTMTAKEAVLIGGGVIGIEMAWELLQLGIHCTILEVMPRLMARQLDEESASLLQERIMAAGCSCYTGIQISEITGEDQANGVSVVDGRQFPADIVILSTGVRAAIGPARAAGLACERGVLTNAQLMTSDPDILAAGDCIQCEGPNPGLWNYARISGETAGYNAVHPEMVKTFTAGAFPLIMSAMGMGLFAVGTTAKTENVTTAVKKWKNEKDPGAFRVNQNAQGAETYEKRFYQDGKLCGAVLIGDISGMAEILNELEGEG
ncbi:MAG: NAD(P)/FAD-dependent oxidoreductase [Firmicutes bacterium]|nr:NAD(P)/FAD-dependent oxidoreductase [Bacillota bacterium]